MERIETEKQGERERGKGWGVGGWREGDREEREMERIETEKQGERERGK